MAKYYIVILLVFCLVSCKNEINDRIPPLPEDLGSNIQLRQRIKSLGDLVKEDPSNDQAHYQMAKLYAKLRQVDQSFSAIKKAISINPDELTYQVFLLNCLCQLRLFQDAEDVLAKVGFELDPKTYDKLAIDIFTQTGQYNKALDIVNQRLTKSPKNSELISLKGILVLNLKDTIHAKSIFDRAISIDSTIATPYLYLSELYNISKSFDTSSYYAQKAYRIDSTNSKILFELAYSYKNLSKKDSALKYYNKAIFYDSMLVKALYNTAIIYLQQNNFEKAEEYLKKIIILKSDIPNLEYKLAVTYLKNKKYEDALTYFQKIDTTNINYNFAQQSIKYILSLTKNAAVVEQKN